MHNEYSAYARSEFICLSNIYCKECIFLSLQLDLLCVVLHTYISLQFHQPPYNYLASLFSSFTHYTYFYCGSVQRSTLICVLIFVFLMCFFPKLCVIVRCGVSHVCGMQFSSIRIFLAHTQVLGIPHFIGDKLGYSG